MDVLIDHWQSALSIVSALLFLALYRVWLWLCGVHIVPDDSVGIVTKKFVLFGRNRTLPDGRIIALNGEAGYQADTLSPGMHLGLWPWQYSIELAKFLSVPAGKVGTVEACDGRPLASGRIVARRVDCDSYQDARAFLANGGERGPQMTLIPPGTYRVNSLLFKVSVVEAVTVPARKGQRRRGTRWQTARQRPRHRP